MKLDRSWVVRGLWLGVILTAAGYLILPEMPLPRTMRAALARSDFTLWGMLMFPVVALMFVAAVTAVRRRDATRWVSMAIGATVAAIALVAIVVSTIGVISWIVSGPVPNDRHVPSQSTTITVVTIAKSVAEQAVMREDPGEMLRARLSTISLNGG